MVSLSKIASLERGANSGVISKPADPRRNQGLSFSGSSVRCQAVGHTVAERAMVFIYHTTPM
jgi:hypothetical protein